MPWLELSAASIVPMGIAALLLIVSGILVGVAGDWWFNGQWWLWVSVGSLVVIVAVMTPLVSIPMGDIRRASASRAGRCQGRHRADTGG